MYNPVLTSRIHKLNCPSYQGVIYLKRDDELSCTVSGSKVRKYSTLVPHIIENSFKKVGIIGGQNSNNLLGLAQVLIEIGVRPIVFIKKITHVTKGSNFDFLKLFVPARDIIEVDVDDWASVEAFVEKQYSELYDFLIPEGAKHFSALKGAESLGTDIVRNFECIEKVPSHIFIDSGTGVTAGALIKSLGDQGYTGTVHVLDLVGSGFRFSDHYSKSEIESKLKVEVHRPESQKAFGSIHSDIFNFIRDFAAKEGVLLDPVYSSKLLRFSLSYSKSYLARERVLVVHSGGQWALNGFHQALFENNKG
jgi:1-aminocyclopropane-1-carboxylate deaminase